jgi:hypothetical protein
VTQINLPNKSVTGTNFWSQVEDNDQVIADVVNGDLDASNLADGAVTTAKIGDSQVTTEKINNGAVTGTKLAASTTGATGGITARKYADGQVVLSGQRAFGSWPGYSSATSVNGIDFLGVNLGTLPAGFIPASPGIVAVGNARFSGTLIFSTVVVVDLAGEIVARVADPSNTANPLRWYVDGITFHAA